MLLIKAQENSQLSYVLRKNPQTSKEKGGFKDTLSAGTYWGYYLIKEGDIVNGDEFHLRFLPSRDREEIGSVEQFPISHITDPSILRGLISNLLKSAWRDYLDIDGPTELEFFLFTDKNIGAFNVNVIESNHMAHHIKQSFPSLFQGLNWLLALCSYLIPELTKDDCIKSATNCNNAGLGYHPRYLISKSTPHSKLFNTPSIHFEGGPTTLQRRQAITNELKENPSKILYDLGAGSLYNTRKLVPLYQQVIAVDLTFGYKAKDRAEEMKIELIESPIEDWEGDYKEVDVLLAEVLEHNSKDTALSILNKVLEGRANKIVITVPNRAFNINFQNEGFRHEEHQWEPTISELTEWLPKVPQYSLSIKGIGDKVYDEYISLMAVYELHNS